MRYFLFFIIFSNSLLYSQKKNKIDSIVYYSHLVETNLENNKYKEVLLYTQKAIEFCKINNKIEDEAIQTYNLGKIYFDLKKYSDAIEILNKSILLIKDNKPAKHIADANYYLGLAYLECKDDSLAEISFNKSEEIQKKLKIKDKAELISLQRGILSKMRGNTALASTYFKSIIAIPDNEIILNTKAEALLQIGTIEFSHKRYKQALNYLNNALELNKKSKNPEQKSNILLALSSINGKMLNEKIAHTYLKQHLKLKDSLTIANINKLSVNDYQNFKKYQENKITTIDQIKNREKIKAEKFSKLISILVIAIISILTLLSLSLYKNNIIRNQTNLLLKEKNEELLIAKNKAEEASKAKSDFLSTVSHELRTPLHAINGIAHLLLEENPNQSQMDYLSSLKFSGNYLTTFINDILEINKLDSNQLEIESISFDLNQLLKDIQNSFKEIAKANNNELILNTDSSIPKNLIGDPTKLSQIFINLINNSLKFTSNGTVKIVAKLKSIQDDNAIVYFHIIDTGIGIPEDQLELVFESFSQGSIEINRKYGGTGLGLTIVKKLVEIMNGKINLKSVTNKGTTFSFKLKFKVDDVPVLIQSKMKNYDVESFKNKKILLVEDNKINQMITGKMLTNKGIECTIIDNGEDAIEMIRNNFYDLVLMDVHLLGMNGTIATQLIREFNTTIPIIALTAISLNENKELLLSFGMTDVITKPFIPDAFYNIIAQNI